MELTERFDDALVFARRLHARQARKVTTIPYMSHLMAVSALVLEYGGTEDQAIAALLHDAIEDQAQHFDGGAPALREEITERFGAPVTVIVDGCTDAETRPKPPWRERKEKYLAHLGGASTDVLLVSAADKLHNARAILADLRHEGETVFDRFKPAKKETLWYYRALVDAFRESAAPPALVGELDRTVSAIER